MFPSSRLGSGSAGVQAHSQMFSFVENSGKISKNSDTEISKNLTNSN